MAADSSTISVFVGECGGKDYVFALSAASAIALAESHFAFGDPAESEYAVSDVWAKGPSDSGWRIREDKVKAYPIIVSIASTNGTDHVVWMCPFCNAAFSDDWLEGDSFPVLLMCGCTVDSKYLIGDLPSSIQRR